MSKEKTESPASEANINSLLEEARMVLPGIQALFGFQLVGVLSDGFQRLTSMQRGLHFLALIASALSVTLVMTPAAHHRIAERWRPSIFFLRLSSWLVALGMAVLLCSLCLEIWVVASAVFQSEPIAWVCTSALALWGIGLWFAWPWLRKKNR